MVAAGSASGIETLPITAPPGYTQIRADYFNPAGHSYGAMAEFYRIWHTGDPTTLTFIFSALITPNWSISEWSGYNPAAPIGANSGQNTNGFRSVVIAAPSITLQAAGSAVVTYAGGENLW